ncbi:energy transducer TonB family protein [Motilimonas pumila]|uniref:Energy transducer TonB n=1 Tax=Motilimonas pumila TaxID=2303987 RepID=A0A418YH72_9GAMM|nr:energy transducer TonB [Motilimonas pumila]RJG49403.1 energy transducer TonB [Motilimonas pumila]
MLKIYLITSFLLVSFVGQAQDLTPCFDLQQCRQQMQQLIYQHWSARHSYPEAKVTVRRYSDLQGKDRIEIINSSGYRVFDDSALTAINQALMQLDTSQLPASQQSKLQHFQLTLTAQ